MKIEFLYFNGCPSWEKAHDSLKEVLGEEGIKAKIEKIKVESNNDAEKAKFLGSPSIRINGKDIERDAILEDYSLRCRVYKTEEGFKGWPSKDMYD